MTTTITCECGKFIAPIGPDQHPCTAAPFREEHIAVFVHGIHIGYAASHVEAEEQANAEIAQQAAEQLVKDYTSCAWDADYEDALRDAEDDRRANEQRAYDLAHAEPQVNPTDTGFRAADFRQQCAATMQAHEDAVRAGDVITFHRWKGARGRSRAKVWTGTVVKPLKLRVRVKLDMGGFMEVDRRDVIGRKAA